MVGPRPLTVPGDVLGQQRVALDPGRLPFGDKSHGVDEQAAQGDQMAVDVVDGAKVGGVNRGQLGPCLLYTSHPFAGRRDILRGRRRG